MGKISSVFWIEEILPFEEGDCSENGLNPRIFFREDFLCRTQPSPKKKRIFGSAKGMIHMSDDFDDPLEDFDEYM